jgi:hypothetical protein
MLLFGNLVFQLEEGMGWGGVFEVIQDVDFMRMGCCHSVREHYHRPGSSSASRMPKFAVAVD